MTAVTTGYLCDWFIDEPHEHSRLGVPSTLLHSAHDNALRSIASAVPVIELNASTGTPLALQAIVANLAEPANHAEPGSGR